MPRRPLKKLTKLPKIEDWQRKVLEDGLPPEGQTFAGLEFYYSKFSRLRNSKKELYELIRDDFLEKWILEHPCSRPWAWHHYDAPRQKDQDVGSFWHGTLPEERRHIRGGRRCEYRLVPQYYKGVFEFWHFDGDDVPLFESEASYLQRLNLLTDSEKRHLEAHPTLLEPVPITSAIPGIQPELVI